MCTATPDSREAEELRVALASAETALRLVLRACDRARERSNVLHPELSFIRGIVTDELDTFTKEG